MPASPTEPMIHLRQRDPQTFTGSPDTDVDDWLQNYERVSKHNRWDETIKLANVVFFLSDTALRWFENNEETLTSWDAFKEAATNTFGHADTRRQQAKERLSRRYQLSSETSTAYIADVLRLCTRSDPDMTETDKVSHLLKGISENLFSVVGPKSPATVHDFISECKTQEDLRGRRVFQPSFQRLPEVSTPTSIDPSLAEYVRDVVRHEVHKLWTQFGPPPALSQPASSTFPRGDIQGLQSLIQDELRTAPTNPPEIYSPAPLCALQHCPPIPPRRSQLPTYSGPTPWRQRSTRHELNTWRTDDNRPVCFYCHTPGHVIRYCHRRFLAESSRPFRLTDDTASQPSASARHYEPQRFNNVPPTPPSGTLQYDSRRSRSPTNTFNQPSRRPIRSPSPYPVRRRSVSPLDTPATSRDPLN